MQIGFFELFLILILIPAFLAMLFSIIALARSGKTREVNGERRPSKVPAIMAVVFSSLTMLSLTAALVVIIIGFPF